MKNNLPNLSDNKRILLCSGLNDSIVLKVQTENLYNLFSNTGANVTLKCQCSTQNLIQDDVFYVREWLIKNFNI